MWHQLISENLQIAEKDEKISREATLTAQAPTMRITSAVNSDSRRRLSVLKSAR